MIRDTEKRHPGDVITHIQYLKPMKKQKKKKIRYVWGLA